MTLPEDFPGLDPETADALTGVFGKLRQEFEERLEETRLEVRRLVGEGTAAALAARAAPAPTPASEPLEELKHAVARIDGATSQADVLTALLEGSRRFASRAAFFLVREQGLFGWGSAGFEEATAGLRNLRLETPAGSPWARMLDNQGVVPLTARECAPLCSRVDAPLPEVGVLLPFMLGDRLSACLYCDRLADAESLDLTALQLLAFVAGQTIETLPVRKRTATSTLRLSAAEAAPAVAEPEVAEPEVAEPAAEPEEAGLAEAPPEMLVEPEEAELAAEAPEAPPTGPTEFAAAPVAAPPTVAPPAPAPPPTPEPEPEEEAAGPEEQEVTRAGVATPPPTAAPPAVESSTLVTPPADLEGPGWAFTTARIPASAGEDARHEEARRLARLLVTEIKLYNEEQVEEGRRSRDLYQRLGDEIERSRQIFEDRVAPEVQESVDYFQEALVKILAGGDAAALGR